MKRGHGLEQGSKEVFLKLGGNIFDLIRAMHVEGFLRLMYTIHDPLIGSEHCNTQIRQLERELALLASLDLGSLAVDEVRPAHLVHREWIRCSQDRQVCLGATADTLECQ